MIYAHLFLLVGFGILSHFVSPICGHAYFTYPTPRNAYCANASCTSNGTLKLQGPIWRLSANMTLDAESPTTQKTCNGSTLIANASIGDTYDPGFKGRTAASWPAGSTQTLKIFVSHLHSPENQAVYSTDGWQIRYRDGTQSNSTFSAINFTYVGVSTTPSIGPAPAIGFQLGQVVEARITVPPHATSDGIFQFYWRNNEAGPGLMWLSCVDVNITSLSTITVSSSRTIVVAAALFVAVSAAFNM